MCVHRVSQHCVQPAVATGRRVSEELRAHLPPTESSPVQELPGEGEAAPQVQALPRMLPWPPDLASTLFSSHFLLDHFLPGYKNYRKHM